MISFPAHKKKVTVLFYSVNGLGLGHLVRLLNIHLALKAKLKDRYFPFFLTSSEASYILGKYGIPYFQVPSKTTMKPSGFSLNRFKRLAAGMVNELYNHLKPDLFIVDTFPRGNLNEIAGIVRYGNSFNVLINRSRRSASYTKEDQDFQNYYNLLVAPHFRRQEAVVVADRLTTPLYWSGPIFYNNRPRSKKAVRDSLKLSPDDKLAYISLGGGADTETNLLLEIQKTLAGFPKHHYLVATGPLRKTDMPNRPNVSYFSSFPASDYMAAADWAISAGGYNSFHELIYRRVPTIFVPLARGLDDQSKRVAWATERDAALSCEPDRLASSLPGLIEKISDRSQAKMLAGNAGKMIPRAYNLDLAAEILKQFRKSRK